MNIHAIVQALGGPLAVSRVCGITRQAVCQWHQIPGRFVLALAEGGRLTPHEMRPDRYPHPLDGRRKARAPRARAAPRQSPRASA